MQKYKEIKIKNGLGKHTPDESISERNQNLPLMDDKPDSIQIGFDDLQFE